MKTQFIILAFSFSLYSLASAAVEMNSADLVKVTPSMNSKCVTYYTYKNELYCSTTPSENNEPVDPHLKDYEKLNIVFDDRPWQLAWGKKDENITTLEYVPMGENVESWNELITSQFFPGLQEKMTPKQFADGFGKQLIEAGYKPTITFLEDTPDQVIAEYRVTEPKDQAQDELIMFTSDDSGIYLLHYVIKTSDMGQKNRDKWVKNLKNSEIKNES